MSAAVNSMIGAQSGSIGRGAEYTESGAESGTLESRVPSEVRRVFSSIADEGTTCGAGSSPPSLGNATCSKFRSEAIAG